MKRIAVVATFLSFLLGPWVVVAHTSVGPMMAGNIASSTDLTVQREEQEGKALWVKLQAKELNCSNLDDEDFDVLGEYFMGIILGSYHAAMNTQMFQMMGKDAEEQMHVSLGKRLSGCASEAASPITGYDFGPMVQMMGLPGGGSSPMGMGYDSGRSAMFGGGYATSNLAGWFGWIFILSGWVLILIGIIVLARWLFYGARTGGSSKSVMTILEERYAKGEIDKEEFKEKKKELL